ncbi:MAG: tRNA (N6-threonylcarbamoyladenosine(37)-N6)-methyltransferase TrmO [Cellvibrionaceae bacterium]|nr:tRNA (N6-threonylcarbamoyladenosine(37)-N6)-methyltransferase TrmO [Cellvibrionaceae bacterium]
MPAFTLKPIAYIKTCFPEKFGVPRQSTLVPTAKGRLILQPPFNHRDYVQGLEQVSHLWLTFIFHQHWGRACKPKVRPPRFGGNSKLGVFASRSSFRPNYLGQSVVALETINEQGGELSIQVSGVDLVDGTPIVDIKPYIPYVDCVVDATAPYAPAPPSRVPVVFAAPVEQFCRQYRGVDDLQQLLIDVLQQDPRPAYQAVASQRVYTMALLDMQVSWRCAQAEAGHYIVVLGIALSSP